MIEPNADHTHRTSRRAFVAGLAGGAVAGGAGAWAANEWLRHKIMPPQAPFATIDGRGLPGRYPGRVREVFRADAADGVRRNREAVRAMLARGMQELVGSNDDVEAWRTFFQRGDRVGIKVVPVGRPDSITSPELVLEVIAGLMSAGVRAQDILVFDRYELEFRICKYDKILPDGVHWECESVDYDEQQLRLDGQIENQPRSKKSSGYDRDVYRELPFCAPSHDPQDDRRFRSHLSKIISQKIDKYIGLPVLKDHRSAGVTITLKNLSHGSVNNVCRSHVSNWDISHQGYEPGTTINNCGAFIPAIVSLPKIREKAVLQIVDGLVATYEGGPGAWNPSFKTWNHNSLLLGTDPVAIDHIGWKIIDKKRSDEGWRSVATMGLEGNHKWIKANGLAVPTEQFQMRQPEHISLAAALGLGNFAEHLINHKRIDITPKQA